MLLAYEAQIRRAWSESLNDRPLAGLTAWTGKWLYGKHEARDPVFQTSVHGPLSSPLSPKEAVTALHHLQRRDIIEPEGVFFLLIRAGFKIHSSKLSSTRFLSLPLRQEFEKLGFVVQRIEQGFPKP